MFVEILQVKNYSMKKISLVVSVFFTMTLLLSSCKKIVTAIFPGIDARVPDITLTVPPILFVPPNEMSLGNYSAYFNLDSIVRAKTNGAFNANDISSVKVKTITITLLNNDNFNNLSNFEYARLGLTSNTMGDEINVVTINFPDTESSTITVSPDNSPEIRPYLSGNQLNYSIYGKLRRATTKPLTMVVSVTVRID